MIGLLANEMVNKVNAGFGQFLVQLFGACFVGIYSMVVSYQIMKFLDKTSDIRVTKDLSLNKTTISPLACCCDGVSGGQTAKLFQDKS